MSYRLIVTRNELNKAYEQELKDFNEKNRYNDFPGKYTAEMIPQREYEARKIEVELTDDEYDKLRKALIMLWDIKL